LIPAALRWIIVQAVGRAISKVENKKVGIRALGQAPRVCQQPDGVIVKVAQAFQADGPRGTRACS
jgi:hypothetical protein